MLQNFIYGVFGMAVLGIIVAVVIYLLLNKKDKGEGGMADLALEIKRGSMAFIQKEYAYLGVFVLLIAAFLLLFLGYKITLTFLGGAILAVLVSFIGLKVSTFLNIRVAQAVHKEGRNQAFILAYLGGSLVGLLVSGIALLGVGGLYWIFLRNDIFDFHNLIGFALGATIVALFMRVGGGIFTKAADVGADLAGKLEGGLPEDSWKNPAAIADLVGDNVGDFNGMVADIFESYLNALIALIIIGAVGMALVQSRIEVLSLPLILAALGLGCSLIGVVAGFLMRKISTVAIFAYSHYIALALFLISAYFVFNRYYSMINSPLNLFISLLSGILIGLFINWITNYYVAKKPIKIIAKATESGSVSNIIMGLSIGLEAVVLPILVLVFFSGLSYYMAGVYGVGLVAIGILITLGVSMASYLFGPVVDNAGGIIKISGLAEKDQEIAESLDIIGNTTSAIGKNISIASSLLVSFALFEAYIQIAGVETVGLKNLSVVNGALLGAVLVFFLSSSVVRSVAKSALAIANEVKNQLANIVSDNSVKPDSKKCINIATSCALKKMILPILVVLVVPVLVGRFLGAEVLAGLVLGTIITGVPLAIFMVITGSAWDNTKKYIEAKKDQETSETTNSAIIGDTIGDPLKDTAGPSISVLIKLVAIIALVLALVI